MQDWLSMYSERLRDVRHEASAVCELGERTQAPSAVHGPSRTVKDGDAGGKGEGGGGGCDGDDGGDGGDGGEGGGDGQLPEPQLEP